MGEFMQASNVHMHLDFKTKEEALRHLSDNAISIPLADDSEAVLAAFHAREEEGATGMVEGFAIPHAKSDCIHTAGVCIQKFENPIADWGSLDGSPVEVAIALLIPDSQASTTHIKLLSKIAVMLMDEEFRDFIRSCEDAERIASEINARLAA